MSLHGTHVTSLLFGQPGSPVVGIAPACRGLVLPVFRDAKGGRAGRVSQLDLARAIERAVEEGAHIINISGGERTPDGRADSLLERALQLCETSGVLVVAAVGNDGCDCLQVPASVPSALAVGATDPDGAPLESNNWGDVYRTNAVLAPGEDIVGAAPDGKLTALTGSSFATPLVTGVAALLIAAQLRDGSPPEPLAAGRAVIKAASASPCSPEDAPECRRHLAGHLDAARAFDLVTQRDTTAQHHAAAHESGLRAAGEPLQQATTTSLESSEGASSMASNEMRPACAEAADRPVPARDDGVGAASQAVRGEEEAASPPARPQTPADSPRAAAPAGPVPSGSSSPAPTGAVSTGAAAAPGAGTEHGVRPATGCGCGGSPSTGCTCGDSGNGSRPLVYALGTIGFDFRTEAARDGFRQLMDPYIVMGGDDVPIERPANPYDPEQLHSYLTQNPWASDKLTWTLLIDSTPLYALEAEAPAGMDFGDPPILDPMWDEKELKEAVQRPAALARILTRLAAPPVNRAYRLFREAIVGQVRVPDDRDYVSRVSIPGVLTDRTTQLFSGERVPVVEVDARGIYTWNEAELVSSITDQVAKDTEDRNVSIPSDTVQKTIRALLDKLYYQFRNLGQSSPDRALNYAATNAFAFGQEISKGLLSAKHVPGPEDRFYALDSITVTKSPYCRADSDCQLVNIVFFDPEDERRSRVTFMFTVDVSRPIPVILAPPRTFLGTM
ncbi:hypothetical protein BGM19_38925 [Streptomyces agglomeratus]|nr:hypothetical protein BGM19_38925 [Streptomyces agglomeratus]